MDKSAKLFAPVVSMQDNMLIPLANKLNRKNEAIKLFGAQEYAPPTLIHAAWMEAFRRHLGELAFYAMLKSKTIPDTVYILHMPFSDKAREQHFVDMIKQSVLLNTEGA